MTPPRDGSLPPGTTQQTIDQHLEADRCYVCGTPYELVYDDELGEWICLQCDSDLNGGEMER
jgi:ribosomal protein L37AE/L43A